MGETLLEADRKPLDMARWNNVSGYDPSFLSERIILTDIYGLHKGKVARLLDGSGTNSPITISRW